MHYSRRTFLKTAPASLLAPRSARAAEATINVYPEEKIGTVHPHVHGHFVEHLGGVVYDGVWVGEASKVPNYNGVRKSLVHAMRELGPTAVRWPGGCFADSYDWRDGIGPSNTRPKRTNFWNNNGILQKVDHKHPAKSDPDTFGTQEFMRFCRLIQAEPYFAANLRSLPAQALVEWIDYCNSPAGSTTLAERRASHGSPEPFNVRYWGIGNESWGCGGDMTPEEYSVEYRRFTSWVPRYPGEALRLIPAGPNSFDWNWTRKFFGQIAAKSPGLFNRIWGWGVHYYCGGVGRGDSLKFTNDEHHQLMAAANRMEELITRHWYLMGEFDTQRRVKIVVDEWGAWHSDSTAVAPHHLFGSVQTMRDAIVASLSMDTFHRHADKVAMANVAQLVNCIQTLFLAHEDKFCVTPTYHVFRMYKDHHNGDSLRTEFNAPHVSFPPAPRPPGPQFANQAPVNPVTTVARLAGSATRKGQNLTVTFCNTHATEELPVVLTVPGHAVRSVRGEVLASARVQDGNTFEAPEAVKPRTLTAKAAGSRVELAAPAGSVVKLTIAI
ncbi:MAG: alpha-L-arabinofuranosidase [Acidobacteria bacterium]|nr:alpha-L-arabinofuranosidase [Acidobacteriota bacterium]